MYTCIHICNPRKRGVGGAEPAARPDAQHIWGESRSLSPSPSLSLSIYIYIYRYIYVYTYMRSEEALRETC